MKKSTHDPAILATAQTPAQKMDNVNYTEIIYNQENGEREIIFKRPDSKSSSNDTGQEGETKFRDDISETMTMFE